MSIKRLPSFFLPRIYRRVAYQITEERLWMWTSFFSLFSAYLRGASIKVPASFSLVVRVRFRPVPAVKRLGFLCHLLPDFAVMCCSVRPLQLGFTPLRPAICLQPGLWNTVETSSRPFEVRSPLFLLLVTEAISPLASLGGDCIIPLRP